MPTASITSTKTGQTFEVDFTNQPTADDIDEVTSAWETEFYQREGLDPSIAEQGVVGTAGNAFARDLGGTALDAVGGVAKGTAEMSRALGPMGNALRFVPGVSSVMSLGDAGDAVAGFTDAVREESRAVYPVNPANPVAETIGGGAGQAVAMLGTMGAAAPVMGTGAALTVVPSALGGVMGLGSGIDTAKGLGIDNPAGRLALGAAFGGAEAVTERMWGIGGKAAAEALQQGVKAGLKQAGKSVLGEAVEEPISGTLQDAATFTAGQFVADPKRPGYTTNGTKLPDLDAEFWKRRKLEAIGGAAGGAVFGGLQLAASGKPAPATATTPPPLPVSEDLGELTAEDVADLEPDGVGQAVSQTGQAVSQLAPILGNVPDGGRRMQGFQDEPLGATAPGGGGNVLRDFGIAKSPNAQAIADAAEVERQRQVAAMQVQNGVRSTPRIPDSPLGALDILDYLNETPLKVARKGSEDAGNAENDWSERFNVPMYYRKFIASSERGYEPSTIAQQFYEQGLINEPTVDALMSEVESTINARTQYRVQFRQQAKAMKTEAKQVSSFERDQARAGDRDKTLVALDDVTPGDEMLINGEKAVVRKIDYDEDGYLTNVVIEDGKRYGVLSLDPTTRAGVFVDEYQPRQREQGAPDFEDPFTMQSMSEEELAAEKARAKQRADLAERQSATLKGDAGEYGTPDMLDSTAGDMALFSQTNVSVTKGSERAAADQTGEQAIGAGSSPATGASDLAQPTTAGTVPDARVPAAAETSGMAGVQPAGEAVQATAKPEAEALTFDEYAARQGVSRTPPSFPESHRAAGGVSKPTIKAKSSQISQALAEWQQRRDALKVEYDDAVERGEIQQPGRVSKLEQTARGEGEAAAAAQRLLAKRGFKNLKPGGKTAGFVNGQILAEAETLIRDGFTDFANWSRAMVTRFGQAIRQYLQGIWEQVVAALPNDAAKNVRLGRPAGGSVRLSASGALDVGPTAGKGVLGTVADGEVITVKVPNLEQASHANIREIASAGQEDGAKDFRYNPVTQTVYWGRLSSVSEAERAKVADYLNAEGYTVKGHKATSGNDANYREAHGLPGKAAVKLAQGGFVAGPGKMKETQSRFARPEEQERLYQVREDVTVKAAAEAWVDSMPMADAVAAMEAGRLPADMTGDVAQHAAGLLIQRTTEMMKSGSEVVQMQARSLGHRISKVWQGWLSQEAGRNLRQRSVVNSELTPYAPILAAEGMLIDRADAVMDKRFEGGAKGVKAKIQKILADADLDISERVERILATVMQAALKPVTSIKDAVAGLLPGKSQREQMIEDVAQALMVKARGNVVTPERKTALAALAASLKQTLGASVQGDAKKAAASPLGEVLARAFVDQVSEAKLFREAWEAGRQSVFDMFYDMELDKAYHPARMRAEQARARLMQLEGGNAAQRAASAAERADLKQTLEDLKVEMQAAKAKADSMTDAFWKQVGALMPATPTMAYAPGMSKEAIKRGFEAAGYTAEIKTGMNKDGTRTLNVQDALRDPQRAMTAVLNVWDAEAVAAGIDPAAWQEGRKIAWAALQETMMEWQKKADERAAKMAQAQKDALLAKDSPALVKLLKDMAGKIAPGMDWTEIFTDLQGPQKERQRAIYARIMKNERLQGLTMDERLALTNELNKAWQQERRKVFNRELTKAGILGEKSASDRLKVKNAMPKLLRLINLGMMNSEMFREAIAPEYGLKQITTQQALALRKLAEDAYALQEGVLRSRKLAALLDGIQKSTGTGLPEVLNQYWVAAVLSGMRTQFDTFMSVSNGFGNQLIQSGMLALKNGNRAAAVVSMMEWWRGLKQAFPEAMQILAKGDYSYLKRFNEDLKKALEGETTFRPVPLGEALWRDGNAMEKYGFAPVMIWTGRLMAAADHLNNSATTAGAKVVARALHPELYKTVAASQAERDAAAAQARREVTGGAMPATAAERATAAARTREILNGQLRPEERTEAAFMGDQAAYQNDPVGVFGGIYQAVNKGMGSLERGLQEYAEERGADGPAARYARGLMIFLSGAMRSMMGAKFIRFGANFGNDMLGYVPGTVLLSPALLGTESTRSQRQLLMGKNVFGLMAGLTVAAMFLGKDDEEEGWHMEGPWTDLTPEEAKQRRAAGFEPLTFWKRTPDKVQRVSYKQWPTAGLLAGVAHMQDRQRFRPEKWANEGMAGHLLAAASVGAFQVKDVSAMRGLADLLGASKFGTNPEDAFVEKMAKMPINFAGGFIPTLAKDLDALADPRRYKPATVMEEFLRNVPLLRQRVAGGRPEINILGVPIEQDRKPWSRAYTDAESGPAHAVLGSLSARGFTLPTPETNRKVWKAGAWTTIAAMGADAEWRYQKKVGDGYRAWLGSPEGYALLTNPDGLAVQRLINRQAEAIKLRAVAEVVK